MHIPHITTHTLSNGATLLLLPDHTAPLTSIQYWIPTGSIHEGSLLGSGLSHLLEHLIFKGTPTRNSTALALEIQDLGGHLNAYTSYDRTVYHLDLPAAHTESALDILSDALLNPAFPAQEFEPEKDVIRREFAMGEDNPDNQFWKIALATAFSAHPIRHPIIGHIDLFNTLTREHVVQYFNERYAPQNIILAIVGDIEPQRLIEHLEKSLAKSPRRLSPDIPLIAEPRQIAPRRFHKTFPTELTRVAFLYKIPGFHHPDTPALEILAMLAGEGLSAWLHRQLVEDLGLAEEITAFTYAPCDVGIWGAEAYCLPDQEASLTQALRESISTFATRPISTQDLSRIKNQILSQHYHQLRTMHGQASGLGQGWLLARDPALSYRYIEKINSIGPEQIQQAARTYLTMEQENLITLSPPRPSTLSAPQASAASHKNNATTPHPSPAAFHSTHTMPPYIYIPEATLPLFGLKFSILGALLAESPDQAGLARLTIETLIKSTQHHNAAALAEAIENLGGQLHTTSGNNTATIAIDSLYEHQEPITDLFAEILSCPKFEAQEVETEKRKQLAALAAEMDNPLNVARKRLRSYLYPDHPYARTPTGTAETLSTFTADHVRSFWHHLYHTSPSILAIHSPEPKPSSLSAIAKLTFKSSDFNPSASPLYSYSPKPLLQSYTHHEYHPKDQAILITAFPTIPVAHEDRAAMDLAAEALSDLGSRLFLKIREELGLAYFVGASQFIALTAGHFAFYLGTDPAKLNQVQTILAQEITRLAEEGLTQEELRRSRAKLVSLYTMDMQNASTIAHQATLNHLYGLGYDYHTRRISLLEAIDLDKLNETIARYLHPSLPHVTVTLSPLHPQN